MERVRHVIMDLDGVLFRGEASVPNALETLARMRQDGVELAFLTNGATRHRDEVAAKMSRLGFECSASEIWTSAFVTAQYLAKRKPGARVFVVGTQGLARELIEAGVAIAETDEDATHVVVGLDTTLAYRKLALAHRAICRGAAFFATNADITYPDAPTTTAPGAGAIVAALEASTGTRARVMGKPAVVGAALIAASWGVTPAEIVAVGDRLETDVAAAKAFGCFSVLVLTGVATRSDADAAPAHATPDAILEDLSQLPTLLAQRLSTGPQ